MTDTPDAPRGGVLGALNLVFRGRGGGKGGAVFGADLEAIMDASGKNRNGRVCCHPILPQ